MTHRTGKTGSNSKAEVEKNKRLATQRIAEGATRAEVQAELGVCRQTVANYLRDCEIDWAALNATTLAPIKKKLIEELLAMAEAVLAGEYPEKKVETWRGLMSDFAKVAGLNAPTTNITAHINTSGNGRFHRFVQSAAGLSDAQMEQVFRFAASLEREPLAMPAGPPPLMLEAASEEEQ